MVLLKPKSDPNTSYFNWNVGSSGTFLKLGKNSAHTFSNNSTTNRVFYNLKGSDEITIRLAVDESDLWPDADDDLGISYFNVPLVRVINSAPNSYSYFIDNYGKGSSFMDVTFLLTVKATHRR